MIGAARLTLPKLTMGTPRVVTSPYSLAASSTDSEDLHTAIMELAPVFSKLPDAVLHVATHDDTQPVGPLVGNPSVQEETLRYLAKFELSARQGQRDASRWRLERVVLPIVGAVAGLALTVAGFLLKSWLG